MSSDLELDARPEDLTALAETLRLAAHTRHLLRMQTRKRQWEM